MKQRNFCVDCTPALVPAPHPGPRCGRHWAIFKVQCVDCRVLPSPPRVPRNAPHPGPRCATHHREERARQKKARHDTYVGKTYGLEPGEYARLKEFQQGVCYICQRAKGIVKQLPVDHDHATGEPRGLLCGPCNQGVLGHLRDDTEALLRAFTYLKDPPLRRMRNGQPPL